MTRVGVGLSKQLEPRSAVHEALEQAQRQGKLESIDWALVFFTAPFLKKAEEIYKLIQAETQCTTIAGCSGSGVIANQEEVLDAPALTILIGKSDTLRTQGFCHYQERRDSISVGQQLKEGLETFGGSSPLVLCFPDAYGQTPHNLINTFNYAKSKPQVFGAGACDDGTHQHSMLVGPKGTVNEGVAGLCFDGISDFNLGITQSCVPVGDPLFITKAEDNVIHTLDGFPALEVFSTLAINQGIDDFDTAVQKILVGFPLNQEFPEFVGESCLVQHLTDIDVSSQGIVVPYAVEKNDVISFMFRDSVRAEYDLQRMLERLKAKNDATPTFGIYLNCAARGENLYGMPDVDTQAIFDTFGEFPLIGFFGAFEMAALPQGLQLYTYTGVLLLVYAD